MSAAATAPDLHVQHSLRALNILFEPEDVIEIRALGVGRTPESTGKTYAGYFDAQNKKAITGAIRRTDGSAEGVYVVLNKVNPALLARANNVLKAGLKNTTTDADILALRWLYIDIDPKRPAGISSTDAEHQASLVCAITIRDFLSARGWPMPIYSDSGNGANLLYRLPAIEISLGRELIASSLKALAAQFNDALIQVDESTCNPSRLCKLQGTMARKGDSLPDRPHRRSRILDAPQTMIAVPLDALEKLATEGPSPRRTDQHSTTSPVFDIEQWLANSGLEVLNGPHPYKDGRRWIFRCCPFNPEHKKAAVFQLGSGALGFHCFHNSCANNDWRALRRFIEPKDPGWKPQPIPIDRSKPDAIVSARKETNVDQLACEITAVGHFAKDLGGKLYVFKDGVYRPGGELFIHQSIKRLLRKWDLAPTWTSRKSKEVVEYIRVDAPDLWDSPPTDVLNLANGLLHVKTRELSIHSPNFLSSVQLPVCFDPEAKCPAWEQLISQVFPEDAHEIAWQIPAWVMMPDTSIQHALLLTGEGANGKSVYLRAIVAFVGKGNTTAISLHKLEQDKYAPARLLGKLANVCPDLPSAHLAGTSVFKALTGGDVLTGEYKYRDSFEFVPFAKLLFSANQPPRSDDPTHGFFRRWVVVPFTRTFDERSSATIPRAELDAKLATPSELSGVLNKALQALPTLQEHGLAESESMRRAWTEFRQVTDPLSVWLDQNTFDDPEGYVPKADLMTAYNISSLNAGRTPLTKSAFGLALKRLRKGLGEAQRTVNHRMQWCYTGIRIK